MHFAANLKLLRKRKKLTQDDLARLTGSKRTSINNYENQIAAPPLDMLLRFSDYFNISIDTLVRMDLNSLSGTQLYELENGNDVYLKGSKLRLLTATVGPDNEENIELVPEKAKAGYLTGFADPEYMGSLPVFRLPFLDPVKKYRTFQISGDSMLPVPHGAWVTGEFVADWTALKDGEACILFTLNEGLSFKRIENHLKTRGLLRCISLNPLYEPYDLPLSELREVWRFVHYISPELPHKDLEMHQVARTLDDLRRDVGDIKAKLR